MGVSELDAGMLPVPLCVPEEVRVSLPEPLVVGEKVGVGEVEGVSVVVEDRVPLCVAVGVTVSLKEGVGVAVPL